MIDNKYVRKHKFRGDLEAGETVYLVLGHGTPVKGKVYNYTKRHWGASNMASINLESGRRRYVETRDSGYWGADYRIGFLMREKDINFKDLVEDALK